MSVLKIVLSVLLGVLFSGGGIAKLAGMSVMRTDAQRLGFSYRAFRGVGALELAGGIGLVVGLAFKPLASASAAGLVALTIGAVLSHLRAKDPVMKTMPAVTVSFIALATGILTAIH